MKVTDAIIPDWGPQSYGIYKTNIEGLGWAVSGMGYKSGDSKTVLTTTYKELNGSRNFANDTDQFLNYYFIWYKYGEIKATSGTTVNLGTVMNYKCGNLSATIGSEGDLIASPITIIIEVKTCNVDSPNETIKMPMASLYGLNSAPIGVYDSAQGETQITIKDCSVGVKPMYTVTAKIPVAGNKQLIGFQSGSTASGLAVQLKLSDGTVLDVDGQTSYNLGIDGVNVAQSTTANEVRTLKLIANLYKTGTVTAGTYTALVDVNVMYK